MVISLSQEVINVYEKVWHAESCSIFIFIYYFFCSYNCILLISIYKVILLTLFKCLDRCYAKNKTNQPNKKKTENAVSLDEKF